MDLSIIKGMNIKKGASGRDAKFENVIMSDERIN